MRRISMDIYTLPFIGVVFVYFDRLVFVRIWIREAITDHTIIDGTNLSTNRRR